MAEKMGKETLNDDDHVVFADDDATSKENPFGLDDVATPGTKEDWARTPMPEDFHRKKAVRCPPKFSDLDREAQGLFSTMDIMTGFRFEFNRMSGPLTVGHSMCMGDLMGEPDHYSFTLQYATPSIVGMGRATSEGEMLALLRKTVTPWLGGGVMTRIGPESNAYEMNSADVDLKGDDCHANVKLQLQNGKPIGIVSYTQAVTPALALGVEGQYVFQDNLSSVSFLGKYSKKEVTLVGSVAKPPLSSALAGSIVAMRKVLEGGDRLWMYGTRLEFAPDRKAPGAYTTKWALAWDYKMPTSSVKGHVNESGQIFSSFEERINPFMSINLGAMVDFMKSKYKFGFGLNFSIQELSEEQQRALMAEQARLEGRSADAEE
eukprot:CAMPEP_0119132868 /NCGR_PEP_ID=MMETSP1310-20130426/12469_1 /TAXON_ID=464262 /ORGANISM="Genus nov. species nov., Strain RCC2339" /LENGTH=375 /DNA_ID=CAMNT_0007123533 /DNA_START=44 /DNA_END=1168 /DNA_ORIENTATION=-